LLTFPSLLSAAALLVAIAAFMKWRQTQRRLERLAESYWELRYEYGQLRARIDRVETAANPDAGAGEPPPGAVPASFIPLSSLKK
jgi:hypothetical protein